MKPTLLGLFTLACVFASSCREGDEPEPDSGEDVAPPREVLVFPDSLRVDDESVNGFVEEAMRTCVGGVYEPFRMLWSAAYDPIERERFEKHWQSVREIHVQAVEKDPEPGSLRYALCADVLFDTDRLPAQHELHEDPRRRVVLLIVREENRWRLARASKQVRRWLTRQVAERLGEPPPSDDWVEEEPPARSGGG